MILEKETLVNIGSISADTMKAAHLLQSFAQAYFALMPKDHYCSIFMKPFMQVTFDYLSARYDAGKDFVPNEILEAELLDEFFDFFNELCPEGIYFGSHPSDGADFGFWEID